MPNQPEHHVPEEFAGNEWLVEELFEQYQQDKDSVEKKWWPIFEKMQAAVGSTPQSPQESPSGPAQDRPKAQPAPAAEIPAPAPASPSQPAKKPAPAAQAAKASSRQTAKPAGQAQAAQEQEQQVVLRGPAKAVVSTMEESLEVPTATTVRAVPAKLLIDNRLAINAYLKRTRGGKISFTHIIGYAVIRAAAAIPSMNVVYGTNDKGKPVAIHPATSILV